MLGIIDWGIGGVGIYKLIKERLGDVPIVYFSDTGVTPYGKMSRSELIGRLNSVIAFLKTRGVTHLVIGCNAASTAIENLDPQGVEIIGMIESGVAAAMKQRPKQLGLIGGRRTVLSGVYRKAFAKQGITVEQRIAQPLSGFIESGDTSSNELKAECNHILSPLRNCSHILLACTHYPAISNVLGEFAASATIIFIDPANELISRVRCWNVIGGGAAIFLTTGSPREMRTAAFNAWSEQLGEISRVILS